MPAPRTEITEIVTGLAIAGAPDVESGLREGQVAHVADDVWRRLRELHAAGSHRADFAAAFANGAAFLRSADGLRGRPPRIVEWKGPTRAPGDEVVPADLRVDHVWLISCKYLSKLLANAAPSRLFDGALAPGRGGRGGDWYSEVAPEAYQSLYEVVRLELAGRATLPPRAVDLAPVHRGELRAYLDAGWSSEAQAAYRSLAAAVSQASAARWKQALRSRSAQEALLWRLLRVGSAPYFVLGASRERSLRLRVMTPWDWRQAFELRRLDAWADDAGQPQVRWQATIRDRGAGGDRTVEGHVEVRWSHGRFGRPPEAKVYLDTPHHRVPGYVELV